MTGSNSKSLLEKAKEVEVLSARDQECSAEELALALAYARGEIVGRQVMVALDRSDSGNAAQWCAAKVMAGYRLGMLVEKR